MIKPRWFRRMAAVGLGLLLTACTLPWGGTRPAVSSELSARLDCRIDDWRLRGETAGARGERSGVVESHLAACQAADPEAARSAFLEGHAEGRAYFCTRAGHYVHARAGGRWRDGCTDADTDALRAAFDAGHEVHLHREALAASERRLADIEQYLRVGQLKPRDQERFGDTPRAERDAHEAAKRALYERDARYAQRFGAPALTALPAP
ncbi:DUF2799 domain-containing protein [Algiphilus sp.]|uniref:DUF2799 domain-containing protein n=1 Tax=Algiphilus sp. TaxID=1872431 RepID=UPI003B526975